MAKINLDLTNVQAQSEGSIFSVVPAGEYKVVVAHCAFKESKANGWGLTIGYMVEEGKQTGKMIQEYVTVKNDNTQAEEIGQGKLKRILELQARKKFLLVNDTDLISAAPFKILVEEGSFQDKDGKDVPKNTIKKYMALDSAPSTTTKSQESNKKDASPAEDSEEEATSSNKKKMPWEK